MLGANERWKPQTDVSLLEDIRIKKPSSAGSRWKGTAHHKLIAAMNEQLKDMGLTSSHQRYYLYNKDRDIVFACNIYLPEGGNFSLYANGKRTEKPIYLVPSFGFTASNSRRRGLKFYAGVAATTAEYKFVGFRWYGKPYTVKFSPARQMQMAIDDWKEKHSQVMEMIEKLRLISLSESRTDKILMEAGYRNLMPWSRVGRLADLLMQQSRMTAWKFILEYGRAVEMNPPSKQMEQMYGVFNVIRELYPEILGEVPELEEGKKHR